MYITYESRSSIIFYSFSAQTIGFNYVVIIIIILYSPVQRTLYVCMYAAFSVFRLLYYIVMA